jgi:hypothetical protein
MHWEKKKLLTRAADSGGFTRDYAASFDSF